MLLRVAAAMEERVAGRCVWRRVGCGNDGGGQKIAVACGWEACSGSVGCGSDGGGEKIARV